ncbi:MAG: hypothetical protein HY808_10070 [Nitrospirae bacterium]|nr:hypothetical protein [Nitrospirota bacterium]
MKKLIASAVLGVSLLAIGGSAFAGRVNGYYRSNGTYVQPHYRSNPDSSRANNYGPSKSYSDRINPYTRDNDRDGTPNYLDTDDNNNGIHDDNDSNQYGR